MSYPISQPGKILFSGIVFLLFSVGTKAGNLAERNTLYNKDTTLSFRNTGIVRQRNGDIVIAPPVSAMGHYKIRFFDDKDSLLFEIRQIQDPVLIVEKYNFGHAGKFQYALYRDNGLVEKASFWIDP